MVTAVSAAGVERGPREYSSDLSGAGRSRFCRFWDRGLLIAMSGGAVNEQTPRLPPLEP